MTTRAPRTSRRYARRVAREVLVVEVEKGRFDVRRGGATLVSRADEVYAKQVASRRRNPDERVVEVALDGYRTDITRDISRYR